MKNNGLIITAIIVLSIVVFLLVMFLVMCLTGRISFRGGIMFGLGSKSTNVIYDNQFELEKVSNIEIREDAGDVIIKETSDDNIKVVLYGDDSNDAKVDLNNGKLNVDNTHKKTKLFGGRKNEIIIYIPSNYSNEIKVKNNYGNCEITDLENSTLNINCDAGDVEVGKIKNATIKCNYGNIEVKEILNNCEIKADCGNIKIDRISIQENSSIKANLGNVDINSTNDIYIEADVDLGKTNIANNNRNSNITLKIKCDCGNITIND